MFSNNSIDCDPEEKIYSCLHCPTHSAAALPWGSYFFCLHF